MTDETAAKLAAVRELTKQPKLIRSREPQYEYMSLKIDQVDFLLRIIDGLTAERDAARFRPLGDNHHNAEKCPHCSPKRQEALDAAAAKRQAEIVARLRTESRQWTEDAEGKANRGDFHNAVNSNHRAAALSDMADELENDAIEADAAKGEG